MPNLLIFDAFMLLICEKNVANYAHLQCKTFSLIIWLCKVLDKYHVCLEQHTTFKYSMINRLSNLIKAQIDNALFMLPLVAPLLKIPLHHLVYNWTIWDADI